MHDRTFIARAARFCAAAGLCIAALAAPAQTTPAAPQDPQPHGRVLFSRTTDENGQTTTSAPAASDAAGQSVAEPTATDAERQALLFTAFDLDVHLRLAEQAIAVRAQITVRNGGKAPLTRIPLQISSSLRWERILTAGRSLPFTVATLNSDIDHTGQLHEAAIALDQPLAPGQSLNLDLNYSGTIAPSAQRLVAIGTPADAALHSDWDAIGLDFTGLRGFGNVLWYPAASVPVILGDGARVFDEMGEHKLLIAGARFRLRLTAEFPRGHAPTVAFINGHAASLAVTEPSSADGDLPGIATAALENSILGFDAPSLFLASRESKEATNATLYALPDDDINLQGWIAATATVTPFLQSWLGQQPRSHLAVLDLPDPLDAAYETGSLLVTALRQAPSDQLEGILAHALTHAWMASPRAWLSEGVAHFMGTLWIERQSGRQKALELLESGRTPLALIEPSSPGESSGQPLAQATAPIYYRNKATYVFWMLRDLVGDPALSAALRAYDPAEDARRGLGPTAGSAYFEKLVEQSGLRRDLSWFFSDWVDNDKGLPDLSIDKVFISLAESPADRAQTATPGISSSKNLPTAIQADNASVAHSEFRGWLVSVDLSNSGYAAAEFPVIARNADTSVTRHIVVPARGKATLRLLIEGKPVEIQANDGGVPETQASVHLHKFVEPASSAAPVQ
jgi:hypothetical protein